MRKSSLVLFSFLLLLQAPPASASVTEIFAELLGRPDRARFRASYSLQQVESQPVKQTNEKLGLRQHSAEASIPLNSLSDKKWKLLLNADADEIRTAARFPEGRPVPNTLWNVGAGLSHLRMTEDNRTVGGSFLLGSSGDQPFAAARDALVQANLVYKIPGENDSAWVFFLSFSNNRGFLNYVPMPGAAYFFKATSSLRMAVGAPFFMLFWSPFEKAVFNLSYFPLYNAQAKFSYFLFGPAHLFLQARYHSKSYFLSDRTDSKERLFYEEAQASAGFSMPLEQHLMLDASIGYSFDRKFFLGKNSSSRKDGRILRPEKTPQGSIRLTALF